MMAVKFYAGPYGRMGEAGIVRFRTHFDVGSLTKTIVSTADFSHIYRERRINRVRLLSME